MWIRNFINELRAWFIVRKTYKQHKKEFDELRIRSNWFGKLVTVINRDPEIKLGSEEDEVYLHNETAKISALLYKVGIMDMLAYELIPFEESTPIDDNSEEYAQGYIITFTPAWNLDKQYVTVKSVISILIFLGILTVGVIHLFTFVI